MQFCAQWNRVIPIALLECVSILLFIDNCDSCELVRDSQKLNLLEFSDSAVFSCPLSPILNCIVNSRASSVVKFARSLDCVQIGGDFHEHFRRQRKN